MNGWQQSSHGVFLTSTQWDKVNKAPMLRMRYGNFCPECGVEFTRMSVDLEPDRPEDVIGLDFAYMNELCSICSSPKTEAARYQMAIKTERKAARLARYNSYWRESEHPRYDGNPPRKK